MKGVVLYDILCDTGVFKMKTAYLFTFNVLRLEQITMYNLKSVFYLEFLCFTFILYKAVVIKRGRYTNSRQYLGYSILLPLV